MVSFKFALLAVVTVLLRGSASTSETGDVSNECTSGFLNFSSIDETSSMIVALPNSSLSDGDPSSPLSEFTQWISPNINFTCNGSVIKWRLRVNASIESINKTIQQPSSHIATWKLDNPTTSSYTLKSITNESQIYLTVTNGSIYYEYTPSPPTPVQAGDFIGILLPDVGLLNITPLFLRLPENSNAISCVRLSDSRQIFLPGRKCQNTFEQQSRYIPLVSVILSNVTLSPTSLPPTATPSSTQSATTIIPTPSPISRTTQDTSSSSTTMDLAAPPQSGDNSGQLVGVIIGASLAAVAPLLIVLAISLVLLTTRRGQKLYNVPITPQPKNMHKTVHTQILDSQSIEVKNNEAYSLSTTQQIPTEDNVAYGQATPQISTVDNVAYGQATPQIQTEANIAYGQAIPQLQITTGDNVAYGHREDDYAAVSDPTEYDYV